MSIESTLKTLRVRVRKHSKIVLRNLFDKYLQNIHPVTTTCCSFCGATANLTREHVLPLWVFQSLQGKFYVNQWNLQRRKYAEATVPACKSCNNEVLSSIERHIKSMFTSKPPGTNSYDFEDYENIIRWLEVIHYKFKVHDLTQKFIAHKKIGMIEGLRNLPLSVMMNGSLSFFQVEVATRKSMKRIAIKNKANRVQSLIFFKTSNKEFNFFNSDNFVFLELPQYALALFYFYNREFKSERSAHTAMKKVLDHAYPAAKPEITH